jgi:hypothetical protein
VADDNSGRSSGTLPVSVNGGVEPDLEAPLATTIWLGAGGRAGGKDFSFYLSRDLEDPGLPPIVEPDPVLDAVSDFSITYYIVGDVVTYSTHGLLHSRMECPGGWQVSTASINSIIPDSITYNVWYAPARFQSVETWAGVTTTTTGACAAPELTLYANDALEVPATGECPPSSGSPSANPAIPSLGWTDDRQADTGVTLAIPGKSDAGTPRPTTLDHQYARFHWEVATLGEASPIQGVPFTGTVNGQVPGECHSWAYLGGKKWAVSQVQAGGTPAAYSTRFISNVVMFAGPVDLGGSPLQLAGVGTYRMVVQTCDAGC